MTLPSFTVRVVNWQADRDALHAIRRTVFIEEQQVPEELEWDEIDPSCHHVLAFAADGRVVGTGRLLPDGHIGRMAVLKQWRGKGIGSAILALLLDMARKDGFSEVRLHAQIRAIPFYRRHGFEARGGQFMEAGIAHCLMSVRLGPLSARQPRQQ